MDIKELTGSYKKKINLGDCESAEAEMSVTVTFATESTDKVANAIFEFCRDQVHLALEVDKEGAANPYTKRHFKYGKLTPEETIPLTENIADLPF